MSITLQHPVAYFCAEYAITDHLPIYSGGLGVLAGDIVQEAAALKLPFVAVGLFYARGFFHQRSDEGGQKEYTEAINPAEAGLELIQEKGDTLLVEVPINERIVYAQAWRFPVGGNSLYLLDTNHWKNSEADRKITEQLYGGDQSIRIQQELVLALGGKLLLSRLGITPAVYHMNEGHSAFLSLEITRELLTKVGRLDIALAQAKEHLVFTNHTLVPAGNDTFDAEQVKYYLGKYAFDAGIGIDKVLELGATPEAGRFSMTMLAMRMAASSNAVSKLHAQKAAELWPGFKLLGITNGVHLPAWIAPEWQVLLDEHISGWRECASDHKLWRQIKNIPGEQLWEVHQTLKGQLLDDVYARTGIRLEHDALTIVWARRFAAYKRPNLLFADLDRLKSLMFSSGKPIQVIVAGKSHPADGQGKEIIRQIEHLANYDLKHRAVFVDDYSITLSRTLVAGADVWLNTPIFGLEASGTSGMKAASNGALQCTVPDGWAYEVDWAGKGFALPAEKTETEIYPIFEKKIIPAYYRRNRHGVPDAWISMMQESMSFIAPRFSSQRMVEDYIHQMYEPLAD